MTIESLTSITSNNCNKFPPAINYNFNKYSTLCSCKVLQISLKKCEKIKYKFMTDAAFQHVIRLEDRARQISFRTASTREKKKLNTNIILKIIAEEIKYSLGAELFKVSKDSLLKGEIPHCTKTINPHDDFSLNLPSFLNSFPKKPNDIRLILTYPNKTMKQAMNKINDLSIDINFHALNHIPFLLNNRLALYLPKLLVNYSSTIKKFLSFFGSIKLSFEPYQADFFSTARGKCIFPVWCKNVNEFSILHMGQLSMPAFKKCPNIKTLAFCCSDRNDLKIDMLHNFPNLRDLLMSILKLKKIKGLDSLKNLRKLNLTCNSIVKIERLVFLINLRKLNLSENDIEKIEGLDSLKNLRVLYLSENDIKKIEGLDSLKNLRKLYLSLNNIEKIEGLDSLKNLRVLYLNSNSIVKIEGLDSLKNLRKLNLRANKIKDFKNLVYIEELLSFLTDDLNLQKMNFLVTCINKKISYFFTRGFINTKNQRKELLKLNDNSYTVKYEKQKLSPYFLYFDKIKDKTKDKSKLFSNYDATVITSYY